VLDAADRLRDEDVRFLLVGDGPVGSGLREAAARRGLSNVEFRSAVPVSDIGAVLQSCHALLVPLRDHELLRGFIPSKLYDAMAVGRPALVAARGEPADLVAEHEAGLAVPPEDGAALATAVRELAHAPERAAELGAAGRRAAPRYARSAQLDTLESVLRRAAATKTR
jgi:glycosyltransferase involved in cell wall biosynthesis